MQALAELLRSELGSSYGKLSWTKLQGSHPKTSEKIVNAASRLKDFEVFAQAEGQLAIRMLLGQKMKSKARKIVKKSTDATQRSVVTTVTANKKILDPSDDHEDEESGDLGLVLARSEKERGC